MITKKLYFGNGVSLSPKFVEGMKESKYVRLVAEDGRAITNGVDVIYCRDVLATDVSKWSDCEIREEETPTEEEFAECGKILLGVAE